MILGVKESVSIYFKIEYSKIKFEYLTSLQSLIEVAQTWKANVVQNIFLKWSKSKAYRASQTRRVKYESLSRIQRYIV